MTPSFLQNFAQTRQNLEDKHLLRELRLPHGLDFCSNDYLGLASNSELKQQVHKACMSSGLGSTGSRLLRGQNSSLQDLENELAQFSSQEASLFFPTGYQANLALFSSLLKNKAVVFSDELIHASIIDGIKLSSCEKYIWSHNDLSELRLLLKQKAQRDKMSVVVAESIYSMKGDFAPLNELVQLCEEFDALLVVDEAHATGLYGPNGAGRVSELDLCHRVFATVHTAGKALGVSGAWVAGPQQLKTLLVNTSRPFIYSTAPAQYQQVAMQIALGYLQENYQSLRQKFLQRTQDFQSFLAELVQGTNYTISGMGSPITSLIVGDNQKALQLMEKLADCGMDVRAVRPPSVPEGEALLRITLPLCHDDSEVSAFKQSLQKCLGELI